MIMRLLGTLYLWWCERQHRRGRLVRWDRRRDAR